MTSEPQNQYYRDVCNRVGRGVEQRRKPSDSDSRFLKPFSLIVKGVSLSPLLRERADNPVAAEILPREQRQSVEPRLDPLIKRKRAPHNEPQNQSDNRRRAEENQRNLQVDKARHNKRADNQKRRSQQKPHSHRDIRLNVVDIRGHTRDQRGRSQPVKLPVRERPDMLKQRRAYLSSGSLRGVRRHILTHQRRRKSQNSEHNKRASHFIHIGSVAFNYTVVNYLSHYKRNKQLQHRLKKLAQRADNKLRLVILQKTSELKHTFIIYPLPPLINPISRQAAKSSPR